MILVGQVLLFKGKESSEPVMFLGVEKDIETKNTEKPENVPIITDGKKLWIVRDENALLFLFEGDKKNELKQSLFKGKYCTGEFDYIDKRISDKAARLKFKEHKSYLNSIKNKIDNGELFIRGQK